MTKRLAAIFYLGSLLSLTIAICYYRGGNYSNSTMHFQWTTNFLSDLGLSDQAVLDNHQSNARVLFSVAMALNGLAVIAVDKLYGQKKDAQTKLRGYLTYALASLIFLVTLVPSNLYNWPHRAIFVFVLMLTAAWLVLFQRSITGRLRSAAIATDLVLWAYLAFIFIAPRPEASVTFGMIHAQIEKSAYLIFLIFLGTCIYIFPNNKKQLQ